MSQLCAGFAETLRQMVPLHGSVRGGRLLPGCHGIIQWLHQTRHVGDVPRGSSPWREKAELPRHTVPLNSGVLGGSPLCTVAQHAGRWRWPVSDKSSRFPPARQQPQSDRMLPQCAETPLCTVAQHAGM